MEDGQCCDSGGDLQTSRPRRDGLPRRRLRVVLPEALAAAWRHMEAMSASKEVLQAAMHAHAEDFDGGAERPRCFLETDSTPRGWASAAAWEGRGCASVGACCGVVP